MDFCPRARPNSLRVRRRHTDLTRRRAFVFVTGEIAPRTRPDDADHYCYVLHKSWRLARPRFGDALAAFVMNGRATIASACADSSIRLWDASSGATLATIDGGLGDLAVTAFSSQARVLMLGQADVAAVVDLDTGAPSGSALRRGFHIHRFALRED
jgi:hypothetical protein